MTSKYCENGIKIINEVEEIGKYVQKGAKIV